MMWCCTLYRTLCHFNTSSDEYSVLFVSSCTAGLKLIAESFQFHEPLPQSPCQRDEEVLAQKSVNYHDVSQAVCDVKDDTCITTTTAAAAAAATAAAAVACNADENDDDCDILQLRVSCCEWNTAPILKPTFLYLDDNHTSVIGMRCIIVCHGAEFCCISADKMDLFLSSLQQSDVTSFCSQTMTTHVPLSQEQPRYIINSLFAYPAQSNFSGHRYPLEWVDMVHSRSEHVSETHPHCKCRTHPHWYVLLDAAALLTTSTLDLSCHKPDFVVLSFYKMFGFPTGLGT